MAEEFKHGYIDDNPYIVYTGSPNTAYDENMVMGNGYDLIIMLDSAVLSDAQTPTIISGTFAEVKQKFDADVMPTALVYGYDYEDEEVSLIFYFMPTAISFDYSAQRVAIKIQTGFEAGEVTLTSDSVEYTYYD